MRYLILFLCAAAAGLSGCKSVWEEGFQPSANIAVPALPDTQPVSLRRGEATRVDAFFDQYADFLSKSDVAPEDMTPEQMQPWREALARALQLPTPLGKWRLLGTSEVVVDTGTDREDSALTALARRVGATHVVVLSADGGTVTRSKMVPAAYAVSDSSYSGTEQSTAKVRMRDSTGWSGQASGVGQSQYQGTASTSATVYERQDFEVHQEYRAAFFMRQVD